ncbi:MAG: DMT family transporter [Salibacteraceae bacterium]
MNLKFNCPFMTINFKRPFVQWITLILLALTWGSSFILMKKGLIYYAPEEVAAFRISIAMLVLLPISLANLKSIKGKVLPVFATGLFGNAIPAFLFAIAQTEIPSSLSGMLNSLTSLFTLLIGIVFFKTAAVRFQIIGVLIALVGALGLIGFGNLLDFGIHGKYAVLVIIASGCYGIGVNIIKFYLHDIKPTHITSISFLMVGPLLLLYLLMGTDFMAHINEGHDALIGLGYLAVLGVIGTAIAVIIFNRLIKETTAVFASSVTYLIPVVALGWGLIDGENITLDQSLYLLLILGGIFLINSGAPGRLINRLFR